METSYLLPIFSNEIKDNFYLNELLESIDFCMITGDITYK